MPRTIVIHESVFDQINRSNATVAEVLSKMHHFEKCEFWITADTDRRMKTDADRRLLSDLGVRASAFSIMPPAGSGVKPTVTQEVLDRHLGKHLPHGRLETGALVVTLSKDLRKDVELMTTDAEFANAFGRYYGKVVAETPRLIRNSSSNGVDPNGKGYDYNQARRMLGLKPLTITTGGKITPTKAPVAGRGPEVKPIQESGPSPVGQAVFNGVAVGLKIVDFGVQKINDYVQRKRYDEAWAKLEPSVRKNLADDPTRGVLILAVYSTKQKVGAEHDSPLQHTPEFQAINTAYGYTKEDALANYNSTAQANPAGYGKPSASEIVWVPPAQAPNVKDLPTPFPKMGLATFVAGRSKLLDVRWRGVSGFEDDGSTSLSVPAGMKPKFLILKPPDDIGFFWNGKWRTKVLDINWEVPEHINGPVPESHMAYVPFVEVDRRWGYASACMVYPADNDTAQLFQRTSPTKDNLNQLSQYRLQLLRWVEDENLELNRHFFREAGM